MKVGTMVIFNLESNDKDLEEWLSDDRNGILHMVVEVDEKARLFWLKDCPYAVSFDDNFKEWSEVD